MSDKAILNKLNLDTKAFRTRMREQLETLKTLKDMGETLKGLTDADDPIQETIGQTMTAISGIEGVVESLEKLTIPDV